MVELDSGITGVQKRVRRGPLMLVVSLVLVAAGIAYGIVRGEWFFVMYGLYPLGAVAVSLRPPTRITLDGVRRPWRRPGFVAWPEVSSVFVPQFGIGGLRLVLVTGRKVPLDDIPVELAPAVAALGGKETVRPVLPTVRPGPSAPPRPRTETEVLGDVTRQAQQLARQREELAALSRRLRP